MACSGDDAKPLRLEELLAAGQLRESYESPLGESHDLAKSRATHMGGGHDFDAKGRISTARAVVLFCIGAKDFCAAFERKYFPLNDYLTATALVQRGYDILSRPPSHDETNFANKISAAEIGAWLEQFSAKYHLRDRPAARQRIADAANSCRHRVSGCAMQRNETADRLWKLATIIESIKAAKCLPELMGDDATLNALERLDFFSSCEVDRLNGINNAAHTAPELDCLLRPEIMFGDSEPMVSDDPMNNDNFGRNDQFDYKKTVYKQKSRRFNGDLRAIENVAALFPPYPPPEIGDQASRHPENGVQPFSRHVYRAPAGAPLFAVYMFKPKAEKKIDRRMMTYGARSGSVGWHWDNARERVMPLYGLDRLANGPDREVLFVASEAAADRMQELLPEFAVITSPGGRLDVNRTDYSPLGGRKVVFWSSNDADEKAFLARARRRIIDAGAAMARLVSPTNRDWPDTWMLAEELPQGKTAADLLARIGSAKIVDPPKREATETWHLTARDFAASLTKEWYAAGVHKIQLRISEAGVINPMVAMIRHVVRHHEDGSPLADDAIRRALQRDMTWRDETQMICRHLAE